VLPRIAPLAGLRVREDTAFTDASGNEKAGIRKRAEQDLQQASEVLSRMLHPGEAVLYVSRGAFMPNNWEQLLENNHGAAMGALLVLTNTRLIVLRTASNGLRGWKWDQGILSVEWAHLVQAAKKGWLIGYLILKDQKGQLERFFRMSWQDTKKLRLLLGVLVPQTPGLSIPAAPGAPGFVSLCPKCLAALSPDLYRCAQCGLLFKNEKSLLARALLIPGGAYFYTGQTLLGVLAGLVEVLFVFVVIVNFLEGTHVITAVGDPGEAPPAASLSLLRAILFLMFLAFIKFGGFYRARRRVRKFIPA
jgi:hypothetical protein